MSQQTSQSRWQWVAIAVLAAGLLYVGWQLQGDAVGEREAGERLTRLQNQVRTAITEQQAAAQRLAQVAQQVDAAAQGVQAAQSTLDTLQQGTDERLTALQSRLEPAIADQQAAGRRLAQIEDQVFTAITRQQAATQRLTELAGQVESVTRDLREARSELDAAREEIAALATASPAAAADDTEPPRTWTNSLDMAFALIPAGSFEMGSDSGDADEQPVHTVTISKPFYIGQFEVTQAQWHAVMESDPSQFAGDPSRPVESISWNDARAFIAKLNAMEPGKTYRLPTEAEWEYAARAGSAAAYAFGDDPAQLDAYAWYTDNADNTTHPVGEKRPNAWGVYAMHGGVWEWVQERYGAYPSEAATESVGPPPGNRRVIRGGSWLASAEDCRAASRSHAHPAFRGAHVGFRLVRTVP